MWWINKDVYMVILPSVYPSKPNQVWKLIKSLYGLKQNSRQWYEKLKSLLTQHGYTQGAWDHSLFVKCKDSTIIILLVYVDDVMYWWQSVIT